MEKNAITVQVLVNAPINEVWTLWTAPEHIIKWNQPSADWHTTSVENDLRAGGRFLFVMKAKDGSDGFDFGGAYDEVVNHQLISYTLSDGRRTTNVFTETPRGTLLTETFDPEPRTPVKDQELFCTSVLETFRTYAESQAGAGGGA